MYLYFKLLHSIIAFLVLAVLLFSIILNGSAWIRKKPYTKTSSVLSIVVIGLVFIQMMMGLLLYFVTPLGISNFSVAAMKNATSRLLLVEHPLMMTIGIFVIIIGVINISVSENDIQKNKKMTILYSIGLLIILSRIPWSLWFWFF